MGLKNEAKSAFKETKKFYREYVSGMDRETIGREFSADSDRLKQLYLEATEHDMVHNTGLKSSGLQRFYRFFLEMTKRLNPTRRLVFGISITSFLLHYLFSIIGFTAFLFYPLLLPIAFSGVIVLLLIELLEKSDVKKELDLARDIQLSLLPAIELKKPTLEAYSFANTASEVGGDYVDVINTKEGTYVIIADVSGKGLSAALYMVRIQALVHLLINKNNPSPKELFMELNNYVKSNKQDKTFITACCAFFPDGKNQFEFARAGHNPPIFYSKEQDSTFELKTDGFALGMTSNQALKRHLEEKVFHFKKGDSLLLYTDGLNEARNEQNEEYGTERIESIMSVYGSLHAKTVCNKIQSSLEAFIGNRKPDDDVTFTCVHHPE